jgi:hypothetical protein
VLEKYVANQVEHHQLADPRIQQRLLESQVFENTLDLDAFRASEHGQFVYNLHAVLENADHLTDVRPTWLTSIREWTTRVCAKKGWRLSRLGLVHHHLHLLLGCDVVDAPSEVVVSLMNNLAFGQRMKPVFAFGFYVGTFGSYDRQAIRRQIMLRGEY